MREQLTLLQRAVIQRLRDAGLMVLALEAQTYWSEGRPVPEHPELEIQAEDLRSDFMRANAQATPEDR